MTRKTKYNLRNRKDKKEIEKIMRKNIKKFNSGADTLRELRKNNIGYKESDFYQDFRKISAEYNVKKVFRKTKKDVVEKRYLPKTKQARKNKADWFNDVFEKFRKENNMDSQTARKIIKEEISGSYSKLSNVELGSEYWTIYKDIFG